MSKLTWGSLGSRHYLDGVDRGVFYPSAGRPGIPWNGLRSIKEVEDGTNTTITYIDGEKIQTQLVLGSFAAELTAFTYPEEFEEYDGYDEIATGQARDAFHLSYRTLIGNNVERDDLGYQIHMVYNVLATPAPAANTTIGNSIEPVGFSWNLSTTPIPIKGFNNTAHLIIDTRYSYPETIRAIEAALYGDDTQEAHFPSLEEVLEIFDRTALLQIIDHGDGTWTATGPDYIVSMIDATTFKIDWPSVVYLDEDTYTVSSY